MEGPSTINQEKERARFGDGAINYCPSFVGSFEVKMDWKLREWTAVILGLLHPPLALLYLNRPVWAIVYEVGIVGAGFFEYFALNKNSYPSQNYFPLATLFFVPAVFHVIWETTQKRSFAYRPWYSRWYGIVVVFIGMLTIMFFINVFFFSVYRETNDSMFPLIPKETSIVVKKWGYGNYEWHGFSVVRRAPTIDIRRGDVVVFSYSNKRDQNFVKRVVGLPGDRIQYTREGLFVNGILRTKEEVHSTEEFQLRREVLGNNPYEVLFSKTDQAPDFEIIVPPWHLFLLGDNRDRSIDSRFWGPIPEWDIVGKVVYLRR